jgi:hypothetical protein
MSFEEHLGYNIITTGKLIHSISILLIMEAFLTGSGRLEKIKEKD